MFNRLKSLENNFSLSKAAIIVGFFTLVSKLVALARDSLLAGKIGPGDTLDVYYAAFRVPDFIFNLLILGTLSVAFIPIFTEWLIKDKVRAYRFANSVLNIALLGMIFVCLILLAFSGPLTKLLVPGFAGAKLIATTRLTQLFLLSPIIFTASSVFTSILSSYKKFLVISLAPVMYNLGIIAGLFLFYPKFGVFGLGLGVILGAACHMLVQIPEAIRHGYRWHPVFDWRDPELAKFAKLFLPRIIGVDNSQISLIIGTSIGSILAAGSVTIFNFANNLQAVPLGIFALSVSAASFPLLSEHYANRNESAFVKTLSKNVAQVLYFIIPMAILMLIFRSYIVRIILGHGKFNWDNTVLTLTTLGVLTFSLFGQSLSPLFSRSFYARHITKIPVIVNVCAIALNTVLAYIWGRHYGLIGIASAFAVSCTLDALLMFLALRWQLAKDRVSLKEFDVDVSKFILKLLLCSLIMGLIAYAGIYAVAPLVNTRTNLGIIIQAGVSGSLAVLAFLFLSYKLGLEQTQNLLDFLKRIF